MADPRTFVLIGEFKDGITPELQKINNQLAALKNSFSNLGGKGARTASRDMGRLSASVSSLTDTLKANNKELRASIAPLKEYRKEVGKTVSAYKQLNAAGGNSRGLEATNKALREQMRLLEQVRAKSTALSASQAVTSRRMNRASRAQAMAAAGGGYTPPPRGAARGGGGGPGMGPGGFHMAEFGFAYTLGNAISQPVQNAIVSGFQIGVGFMVKPFEYFANRLGERMKDELSDLKAAGGFFSMAQREKQPFVKNFADAITFTQENNRMMAKLAASLPGSTQDYIEVSKRISDSVARTVLSDRAATMKMAEQIRAADIKTYGAKSIMGMDANRATQKTIQVLLGDLTKDTVLAGMGGRAGAGGAMGAYGLPQLSERMISQDEISMGQMQRYSAIFSDPMIMDALQRNIDKINATSKNSADRLKAIASMYKEIVTPELIERYRRTLAGVAETFNTAIFGEETGLFGLGRKMEGLGIKFNEYGQMIDKFGNVTTKLSEAAREDLAIYDLFRDILVNVGQVLAPIVENLTLIYDPLKQLGLDLNKAREATYEILRSFNYYKKGFEDFSTNNLKGQAKELFDSTRDFRASLATIGNLLRHFKVIDEGGFKKLMQQLQDPKANLGKILSGMIDQFMQSDIATKIGEFIGRIIGTVLSEVAKITGFISGRVESSNKLFAGIQAGFTAAGGPEAIKNIFSDVFKSLFKLLIEVMKLIPMEGYLLIAAMAVIPAAVQGIAMAISSGITAGLGMLGKMLQKQLPAQIAKAAPARDIAKASTALKTGIDPISGRTIPAHDPRGLTTKPYKRPQRYGAGGSIERLNRMRRARYARGAAAARANMAYAAEPFVNYAKTSRAGRGAMGLAKGAGNLARGAGKLVPGGALAMGAVDMGLALASGEGFGKAAAGTLGTVIGGSIGTIFGPAGTMIGGIAGNMIGDALYKNLTTKGPSIEQLHAAEMQNEAAVKQLQAAQLQRGGLDPDKATYTFGTAEQFGDRLKVLGLDADKAGIALKNLYSKRESAAKAADKAAKELNQKIKDLKDNKVPDDLIAKQVKPLQEQFNKAKKNLEKSQAEFDAQFRKTPEIIQRSITNSLSALSFKSIESILANKIAGLNIQAPRNPLTLPNPYDTAPEVKIPDWGNAYDNPFKWEPKVDPNKASPIFRARGALGDAIASEMRMKPPGSDLVIANSSETVIPAAGGYGMVEFVDTLKWGFTTMISTFKQAQQKQDQMLSAINQTLKSNQQQTNTRLSAMEKKFSTPAMPGGLGGAAAGGVDAFTGIAQRYGLQMTSGYRPGDPGWHGANRARDFSNGTGPTPQMMQFAQYMAATYGSNLKELIYTPLGFSIKNGQRVPPYAQAGHYNHVHVAYALGPGRPALFGSQAEALSWERSMVPGSVRVGSVTSNSAEGFGGETNVTNNITINQQPGQDANELAAIVALKIGEAVADARAASIFV